MCADSLMWATNKSRHYDNSGSKCLQEKSDKANGRLPVKFHREFRGASEVLNLPRKPPSIFEAACSFISRHQQYVTEPQFSHEISMS